MPFLVGLGGLGPPELLIILAIVVVLFGATRLTGIGGALGKSIREFRREVKEGEQAEKKEPAASEPSEEEKV